jgi:hypothetical protein
MRISYIITIISLAFIVIFSGLLLDGSTTIDEDELSESGFDPVRYGSTSRADNTPPIIKDEYLYFDYFDDNWIFEVNYTDFDGDEGTVFLYIDDEAPENMKVDPWDDDPTEGQYYYYFVDASGIDDYTEFYFTANDNNGSTVTLKDELNQLFLVGNFDGWGEHPELFSPDVYFDSEDSEWVFNVTYWDPDGDPAEEVWLYIDEWPLIMTTNDPDPYDGQEYIAYVLESDADKTTEFYFTTMDINGSYADLYNDIGEPLIVGDYLNGDGGDGGDGDGDGGDGDGGGFDFSSLGRWGDPEVLVGIIALIGMAIASGVGIWMRKRKRKRFSDLLTRIDDVYGSYKMHPRKCERELEKIKSEVDSDLKTSVIDENNYSILKERINEITQEIRSETVRSKVGQLPKELEVKIKDMLIDGRISKNEYNKFMKLVTSSDITSADKKKMEKLMETWLKEDSGTGKK